MLRTQYFSARELPRALALLRRGALLALPTETVYGLATDCENAAGIAEIFTVKGRPEEKPLSLLLSDLAMAAPYCGTIPPLAHALARRFWPGPLTLILPYRGGLPEAVTAGRDTLGLRAPAHPLTLALLRRFGRPLAAPSANPSGRPPATSARAVLRYFSGRIPGVLDGGDCRLGEASTLLDLTQSPPAVLRQGALPESLLRQAIEEASV